MQQTGPFLLSKDVPVEDLGGGLSRQILGYNQDLMLVKVFFEPGAEGYVHHHVHSQVSYVVEGEFIVNINGEKKTLGPGDSFYVAPNIDHGAVSPTGGILIDTFSPVREDFFSQNEVTTQLEA